MTREDQEAARRISEDDLATFEGWLRYQGFDAETLAPDDLTEWRDIFERARKENLATPKVGRMKLSHIPGEYRYAVAVRDGSDLWLTLWVKRSMPSKSSYASITSLVMSVVIEPKNTPTRQTRNNSEIAVSRSASGK